MYLYNQDMHMHFLYCNSIVELKLLPSGFTVIFMAPHYLRVQRHSIREKLLVLLLHPWEGF